MQIKLVEAAGCPMKCAHHAAQPRLQRVVRPVRREMPSDGCPQATASLERSFTVNGAGKHRADIFPQQLGSSAAELRVIKRFGQSPSIERKPGERRPPAAERNRIQTPQFEAGAYTQQNRFTRGIQYLDRQGRVKDGPRQDIGLPGNAVILVKALADDQAEMQMKMNQPAARLVIAEIAQNRRMVPHCDGRKTLDPAPEQNRLGAMLVAPRNEKVEIPFASQHRFDAFAALPVAVRNSLAVKIAEDRQT